MTNSHGQAKYLLHLELDGGLQVKDLLFQVVTVGDQGGELSCLVKTWPEQSWDLLDQCVRCKESIVLLRKFLHLFLILVQLLQVLSRHAVNANRLGFIAMLLVSKQTNFELLSRNMLQLNSSRETFVLLRIIILQTNLEVHGFIELPFLIRGVLQHSTNTLIQSFLGNFTHGG